MTATRLDPHRWPGGARSAVAFTVDADAETIWRCRGVREPVALSQGQFGPFEGLPSILEILREGEITGTFFVPGWVADHYPGSLDAIVAEGHEVGCHGYEHEGVGELEHDVEDEILERSIATLRRFTGMRPVGWRGPRLEMSPQTIPLLAKHGFEFCSTRMDRLLPYFHEPHGDRRILEIPIGWTLDDGAYFLNLGYRPIFPPALVVQAFLDEFDGIHAVGGVTVFVFHPEIIGRPSRLALLRQLIRHVRSTTSVWTATLGQIADHWRSVPL